VFFKRLESHNRYNILSLFSEHFSNDPNLLDESKGEQIFREVVKKIETQYVKLIRGKSNRSAIFEPAIFEAFKKYFPKIIEKQELNIDNNES